MSTPNRLTDQVIARRLAERVIGPNPGLAADIMRAIEHRPQRRSPLFEVWSPAWQVLMLVLILVALAAIAIATAPPPMPPGLQVRAAEPMGGLSLSPDGRWAVPQTQDGHAVISTDQDAPRGSDGLPVPVVSWKGHPNWRLVRNHLGAAGRRRRPSANRRRQRRVDCLRSGRRTTTGEAPGSGRGSDPDLVTLRPLMGTQDETHRGI